MLSSMTRRFHAMDDFESGCEAFFWGACVVAKIPVERFDRKHGIQWDKDRPDSWYAPDFWLPAYKVAVEIKGIQDDQDPYRWAEWTTQTKKPLLVFKGDERISIRPGWHEARLSDVSPSSLDEQIRKEFGQERFPEELRFATPFRQ